MLESHFYKDVGLRPQVSSKSYATLWDWTFGIWNLLAFFVNDNGTYSKNVQINKCVYFNEITLLIVMQMKMKNRLHRYDLNRPRPRHGHKYTKYN